MYQHFRNFTAKLTGFIKNDDGTAAIEFAMLAPLMIATYFGTVEISRAWIAKEKVESVTETVADLVAQGKSTNIAEMNDIFAITKSILDPNEEAKINIVVSAVRTEPNGSGDPETNVTWSRSKTGANTRTAGDLYNELPVDMAVNYETIIITELNYSYTSLMGIVIKGTKLFDRRFITKPRYSSDIPCTDC